MMSKMELDYKKLFDPFMSHANLNWKSRRAKEPIGNEDMEALKDGLH